MESKLAHDANGHRCTASKPQPSSALRDARISGDEASGYVLALPDGLKCLRAGKWQRTRQAGGLVLCFGCNVVCAVPLPADVPFKVLKTRKGKDHA